MSLIINLRHLEDDGLHLQGELSPAELNLGVSDELIRAEKPLRYDLNVELMGEAVLVTGLLTLPLDCECGRCLQPFTTSLKLSSWAVHLPLEGDEKVLIENDCIDLTPFIREDMLLDFPQHPLCKPDCVGLKTNSLADEAEDAAKLASAKWAELDKLKLK